MSSRKTLRCSCGKPLPCEDHTGTDGDAIKDYEGYVERDD